MVYDVGANQSLCGRLSGSGNLIKTGPGRLVLAGSLNYSGKTLVTSGTLAFDGPLTGLYEGLVSNTNGADMADPIPKGSIQRVVRWGASTASIPTTMPIRTSSPTGEIPRRGVTAATSITPAAARSRTRSAKILTMRRFSRSTASRSSAMVSTIRTPRPAFLWRPGLHTVDLRFGQDTGLVGPNGTAGNNGGPAFDGYGIAYNTVGNTAGTGTWFQMGASGPNTQFFATNVAGASSTSVVLSSNTTLDLSASNVPGSVTLGSLADAPGPPTGQQVLLGGNTLETGLDNSNTTFSGTISGSGGLIKQGTGAFTLAGANTYSGSTAIALGTLNLADPLAVQNSTVNVSSSGALSFAARNTAPTLGGLAGAGNVVLATAVAEPVALGVGNNGQSTTFGGSLSGPGSLVKQGAGTLTLTAAQGYGGPTVITGGVLQLRPAYVIATGSIGIHFVGSRRRFRDRFRGRGSHEQLEQPVGHEPHQPGPDRLLRRRYDGQAHHKRRRDRQLGKQQSTSQRLHL